MKRRKKGSILDIVWFTLAFFGVAVMVLALQLSQNEFNSAVQNDTTLASDAQTTIQSYTDRSPQGWNTGLVLAFVGGHLAIIFLGVMLRSHPVIFIALWIAMILVSMMAGYLSDAYDTLASDPALSAVDSQFPMVAWILDHYVIATLIMGFVDLIAFLGLSSLIEGGGGV